MSRNTISSAFPHFEKARFAQADQNHHLSYGMVELPEGKMKSREGTVVDADDLLLEMRTTARSISDELGKVADFTEEKKPTPVRWSRC